VTRRRSPGPRPPAEASARAFERPSAPVAVLVSAAAEVAASAWASALALESAQGSDLDSASALAPRSATAMVTPPALPWPLESAQATAEPPAPEACPPMRLLSYHLQYGREQQRQRLPPPPAAPHHEAAIDTNENPVVFPEWEDQRVTSLASVAVDLQSPDDAFVNSWRGHPSSTSISVLYHCKTSGIIAGPLVRVPAGICRSA
jgi:hypothetical protein